MAKKKEEPEVVEPEEKELVITKGVGAALFDETSTNLFVPIRDDLPVEQRREAVRQVLSQATVADDKLSLVKGEMLFEVSENQYWKEWTFKPDDEESERPYASFEEYCEVEIGLKRRAAYYLISIYKKFVVDLDLPREILKDLEWSKAKELVSIINDDNAQDLLDKISEMSLAQVKKFAAERRRELKGEPISDGTEPSEKKQRLVFRLNADQMSSVTDALAIAESLIDSDDKNKQLDMICSEFTAGAVGVGVEGAITKLEQICENLERVFGVKLDIAGLEDSRYDKLGEESEGDKEVVETASE